MFALFRLNYHNQYYSAYPGTKELNQNKRLWLESLARFSQEQILRAAKQAIEECEYLPNLHRMIELCRKQGPGAGLPSVRDAYLEACNATSPKAAYNWSHPAVYHAGVQSGWYLLANEVEKIAFPVFEKKYRDICQRVLAGEKLTIDTQPLLEEKAAQPLSAKQNRVRIKALKKLFQ